MVKSFSEFNKDSCDCLFINYQVHEANDVEGQQ